MFFQYMVNVFLFSLSNAGEGLSLKQCYVLLWLEYYS